MNRFDRVVSIWLLFQSKRLITAQEMAERFDVSIRTIYRDVRSLEEAGLPIISEAGVGYSLDRGYKLPPVVFDREEALAVFMAEKFMAQSSDQTTKDAYQRALTKIRAVLNEDEKSHLDGLDKRVKVVHDTFSETSGKDHTDPWLMEVQHAIAKSRVVEIDYHTRTQEFSQVRSVEPIGLYFYSRHWHLIAWCQLRDGYRDFRLDRIKRFQNTGVWFDQRSRGDLDAYLNSNRNQVNLDRVVVAFESKIADFTHSQRHWYGFMHEHINAQGEVEMEFLTPSVEHFGRWIMSYTDSVRIIESDYLKDVMANLLEELRRSLQA